MHRGNGAWLRLPIAREPRSVGEKRVISYRQVSMPTVERRTQESAQLTDRTAVPFMRLLTRPDADRTIAIVASVPFIFGLYHRLTSGTLNVPRVCAALGVLITIVTTLVRRPPQRVTPNPLWWLLAFVVTYGPLVWSVWAPVGPAIVPSYVSDVIAVGALGIVMYARFSLGRNIGFVPAQRQIVRSGAYAYVRHPIYTGLLLSWSVLVLRLWTPINVGVYVLILSLVVVKSLVEESFLRHDDEYSEYMRAVKYRFIPGLV